MPTHSDSPGIGAKAIDAIPRLGVGFEQWFDESI